MTPSAHSWKNLKIANEKLKQEILLYSRFLPRRLVMKWMLIWHRKLFNTLGGVVRILCCTFPKSSKQHGFGEKSFCCSCRECFSMHTRWSCFQTILGQNTFSKLKQFAIFGCNNMGAGRIFSREGPLLDFYKIFSRGGQKWWNSFFPTRNQENNLFCWKF